MATTARLVTAEELIAMPKSEVRYELVRGELVSRQWAGVRYAIASSNMLFSLHMHVKEDKLGQTYPANTGFQIESDPDHVRAPSVAFVSSERMKPVKSDFEKYRDRYFPGAPDLAVEVAIPSDTYFYIEDKVADWLNTGARVVIVVNADHKTAAVYRSPTDVVILTEADTLDGGDVVPGWQMRVSEIFE